jgi:hypothetical protein
VTELLTRNNLTAADIDAFELLGGTSRVPRVKQALSEALGGRALDMWVARSAGCAFTRDLAACGWGQAASCAALPLCVPVPSPPLRAPAPATCPPTHTPTHHSTGTWTLTRRLCWERASLLPTCPPSSACVSLA